MSAVSMSNSVSFLVMEGNDNSGWEIVKKTFPEVIICPIMKTVTGTRASFEREIIEHCDDRKVAEVALKTLAESSHLQVISNETSIITLVPSLGCVEVTPSERVISLGGHCSIEEAREKAESKNLPFIEPTTE